MRADRHPPRAARPGTAAAIAVVLLLAGCTPSVSPSQSPSPAATPRPFTIATTGPVTTADPAVATGDTDSIVVTSTYQRLMVVLPGTGELKPDAATDCLFTSKLVYECTLPETLEFHDGNPVDSGDVKFSILRALRLDVAGTSTGLLSALNRIDTPDGLTVRFVLSWPDNQFGYALASQATSIVEQEIWDPDEALPFETLPVGSGPYEVTELTADGVSFRRFENYLGPKSGLLAGLRLGVLRDSVAAEAAIKNGSVEAVWRSLDNAALQRVSDEIASASGFTRFALPGARVTQLVWSESSRWRGDAELRGGVAKALQADRTLDSVVPVGVTDHASAFPLGGRPRLPELDRSRVNLTLGYRPTAPGHADLASLLRDRIENLGGVSVRLVTSGGADLWLTDSPAWVNNATGWLQRYVDSPLPGSQDKLELLATRARTTTGNARTAALTELQQQAAVDATVVPVAQGDGILFLAPGVELVGEAFGSGRALGVWGFTRG